MGNDLIQRIEAAKEPNIWLFEEAFDVLLPNYWKPGRSGIGPSTWTTFKAMLDAQAWTSAAEMLKPSGCIIHQFTFPASSTAVLYRNEDDEDEVKGFGKHPSLALLAAILRAERKDDE